MKERFKMVAAVHLFLIKGDEILLLRRFNTGYEDGNFSVVAGHVDGNEELKEAIIREAHEEAGIVIEKENVEIVELMHRFTTDERMDFYIVCEKWNGNITNMELNKCDLLKWFKINELPDNTIPYIRRAINNYRNSVVFDEYYENEN